VTPRPAADPIAINASDELETVKAAALHLRGSRTGGPTAGKDVTGQGIGERTAIIAKVRNAASEQ
jgi:hypothetical protein